MYLADLVLCLLGVSCNEMLSFEGGHTTGTGSSDRLTVFLVLNVTGSKDTRNTSDSGTRNSYNVTLKKGVKQLH